MGLDAIVSFAEELRHLGWSPSPLADSSDPEEETQIAPPRLTDARDFLLEFHQWPPALLHVRLRPLLREARKLNSIRRQLLADSIALSSNEEWLATLATIKKHREAIEEVEKRLPTHIDLAVAAQREAEIKFEALRKALLKDDAAQHLRSLTLWADAREKHDKLYRLVLETRHDVAAAYLVNGLSFSVFLVEKWQTPLNKYLLRFLQEAIAIWGRVAQAEHAHRNDALTLVALGHKCEQALINNLEAVGHQRADDVSADFKNRRHTMKKVLLACRNAETSMAQGQTKSTLPRGNSKNLNDEPGSSTQTTLTLMRQCLEHVDKIGTHPLRAAIQMRTATETFLHQHRLLFNSVKSDSRVSQDSSFQRDLFWRKIIALVVQWLRKSVLTHDDEMALAATKARLSETYRKVELHNPLKEIQTTWFSMTQTRSLPSILTYTKKRLLDHDAIRQALGQIQDCLAMPSLKPPELLNDETVVRYMMQTKKKAKLLVDVDESPWIPAGTEVDVLLPGRSLWLIRHKKATLEIPASYLEGFGTSTPTNELSHVKKTRILSSNLSLLRSITIATEGRGLIEFANALSQHLGSEPQSEILPMWTSYLDTPSFTRSVGVTSPTGKDLDTAKSESGSVVQRRVEPLALNRSTTAVTTYGRFRPINDDQEFCWRFSYDNPDSQVLAQYNCALSARILLQGKLYITTTAVAFYSAFNETTLMSTIPTQILFEFKDIVNIQKKIFALIFNNAIEFTLKDGDRYVFTSFVRRDKAWATLMKLTKYKFEPPELSKDLLSKRVSALFDANNSLQHDEEQQAIVIPETIQPLEESADKHWPNADYRFLFPVAQFPIPIGLVFERLILNPDFLERVNEAQGHQDTQQGEWDPPLKSAACLASKSVSKKLSSWERTIKRTTVTALLNVPQYAHVEETSELHVHPSLRQIVVASRDVASGPPFTNCFVVLARTRLTALPSGGTQMDLELDFEWLESCWVRGKIEEGTVAEWMETARVIRRISSSILCGCSASASDTELDCLKKAPLSKCLTQWANYLLTFFKQLTRLYMAATALLFIYLIWRLGQVVLHLLKRVDELEVLVARASRC